MTVKDFLQRHPNDTLDMMTPDGYVHLTPESSAGLLEGKPFYASAGVSGVYMELPAAELLHQEICEIEPDRSRSGYFHVVTDIQPPANAKVLEHIGLSGCTIQDTDLSGVCFDGARFRGTRFHLVDLHDCTFIGCDFTSAHFRDCSLQNCTAVDCIFTSAIFEESAMDGLRLQNSDMEAASFYSVDLDHVHADEHTKATSPELRSALAMVVDCTKLRSLTQKDVEVIAASHTLWVNDAGGAQANFSGCLLHGLDLKGLQLNNAIFDGAVLKSCDLSHAGLCFSSFEGTRFFDTDLEGAQAEEASFRDAAFRECDLRDVKLTHSNLSRTKFLSSDLRGADIRHACVEGSDLANAGNWGVRATDLSYNEYAWAQEGSEPTITFGGM